MPCVFCTRRLRRTDSILEDHSLAGPARGTPPRLRNSAACGWGSMGSWFRCSRGKSDLTTFKNFMKFPLETDVLDLSQNVATTEATAGSPHRTFIRTRLPLADTYGSVTHPKVSFSSEIGTTCIRQSLTVPLRTSLSGELFAPNGFGNRCLSNMRLGNDPGDSEVFPSCPLSAYRLN
jgi:hypothetical protein